METNTPVHLSNLKEAVKGEFKARRDNFLIALNEYTEVAKIKSAWQYSDLFTPVTKKKDFSLEEVKSYLLGRYDKKNDKSLVLQIGEIERISKAPELVSVKISVEWAKSRIWGANPTAEAWYSVAGDSGYIKSGSIGGCGYDKLSTAVAEVLNQIPAIKKLMYIQKDLNINVKNNELLGYGAGYGVLPYIEGGVGCSCYNAIFNAIGYKFETVASGKSFDVFTITRL